MTGDEFGMCGNLGEFCRVYRLRNCGERWRIFLGIRGTCNIICGNRGTWQECSSGNILTYFGGTRENRQFFSREQGYMHPSLPFRGPQLLQGQEKNSMWTLKHNYLYVVLKHIQLNKTPVYTILKFLIFMLGFSFVFINNKSHQRTDHSNRCAYPVNAFLSVKARGHLPLNLHQPTKKGNIGNEALENQDWSKKNPKLKNEAPLAKNKAPQLNNESLKTWTRSTWSILFNSHCKDKDLDCILWQVNPKIGKK